MSSFRINQVARLNFDEAGQILNVSFLQFSCSVLDVEASFLEAERAPAEAIIIRCQRLEAVDQELGIHPVEEFSAETMGFTCLLRTTKPDQLFQDVELAGGTEQPALMLRIEGILQGTKRFFVLLFSFKGSSPHKCRLRG